MTLDVTTYNTTITKTTFKAESRLKSITLNERPIEDGSLEEGFFSDIRLQKLKNSANSQNDNLQSVENLDRAFYKCFALTDIPQISSNCKSMNGTFHDCISFNDNITIPATVENVEDCFNGCKALTITPELDPQLRATSLLRTFKNTSIRSTPTIPESITSMVDAFSGCASLSHAEDIPSNVINMERAFYNCTSLSSINYDDNSNVTNMKQAFYNCTSLNNIVTIPMKAVNLYETFYNCANIDQIYNMPKSVTTLERTFYNCTGLRSFEHDIPTDSEITTMKQAFYNCINLSEINHLPPNVTDLMETFYKCKKLTYVADIPENVEDMERTFYECSSLQNAPEISNSVVFMNETFSNCSNLRGVIDINSEIVEDATNCFYTSDKNPPDRNVYIPMPYMEDNQNTSSSSSATSLTYNSFIKAGYSDLTRKHGVLLVPLGYRIVTFTILSTEKPNINAKSAKITVRYDDKVVYARNTMDTHANGTCVSGCNGNKFYIPIPKNTDFTYDVELENFNSKLNQSGSVETNEKNIDVVLTYQRKTFTLQLDQSDYNTDNPTNVSIYVNNSQMAISPTTITQNGGSVSFTYFIGEVVSVKYVCEHQGYNTVTGYEEWDTNSSKTVKFSFVRTPWSGDPKIWEGTKGGQTATVQLLFGYKYKLTCVGGGGGSSNGAGGAGSAWVGEIDVPNTSSVTAVVGAGGAGAAGYSRNHDGGDGVASVLTFGDGTKIECFGGRPGEAARSGHRKHSNDYYRLSLAPSCNINFTKNVLLANKTEARRASWIEGTTYGAGGNGGHNGEDTGEPGKDGYIRIDYIGTL